MSIKFWIPLVFIGLFGAGLISLSYLFTAEPVQPIAQSLKIEGAPLQDLNSIEVNVPSRKLFLKHGEQILKTYDIAVGRSKALMTPIGDFKVEVKDDKPGWTNPYNGKRISPGERNPLGTRWIGFLSKAGDVVYGIHGTNQPESIGKFISHGCIRMNIRDAEELFDQVEVGSPVKIRYDRLELEKKNDNLVLTLYPDPYSIQSLTAEAITQKIKDEYPEAYIEEPKIIELLKKDNKDKLLETVAYLNLARGG